MDEDQLTEAVIGAAMLVHTRMGPGLLESAYRTCLLHELRSRGIAAAAEVPIPVCYTGVRIDVGYRADLIVDGKVLVETKGVERILPIHEAQLRSYLRLSDKRVGLLLNFHVEHMRDGIRRKVNGYLGPSARAPGPGTPPESAGDA